MEKTNNIKVARVSTVPFFVYSQLTTQLEDMHLAGFDVSIISSSTEAYEKDINFNPVHQFIEIEISREINIVKDLKALFILYRKFKSEKFDIIHSTTPKAGLLSSVAAVLSRTPIRIHTFTGQTWVAEKGIKKFIFKFFDWIVIKLNTHCYTDSKSQMKFLISEGVCNSNEISTLGEGSLAGVNLKRFDSKLFSEEFKNEIRSDLEITKNSIVIIFIGRVTGDKGILELLRAFRILLNNGINTSLLLVGPIDDSFIIDGMTLASYVDLNENVKITGFTDTPEKYLSIADIFCLPSYREGFGTVIIESAAMGLPSIASNIYGLSDAVQDNETGILVDVRSIDSLVNALTLLATNVELRAKMGEKAKNRAIELFDSDTVSSLVINEYSRLMDRFYGN